MDRDQKILIGAIGVLVVLFLVVGKPSFTGSVIRAQETTIQIQPDVVSRGEIIYITVFPRSEGVNDKVSFYLAEDNLRKTSVHQKLCNEYKCTREGSFSFVIPSSWEPGVYIVKVYDYGINDFVHQEFTIRS